MFKSMGYQFLAKNKLQLGEALYQPFVGIARENKLSNKDACDKSTWTFSTKFY